MAQSDSNKQPPASMSDEASLFYIPYNDHGQWGYCDTLANILLEPQFLGTARFQKQATQYGPLTNAVAITEAGRIIINSKGESLLPEGTTLVHHLHFEVEGGVRLLWIIQNEEGHTAVYEPGSPGTPDFKYHEISAALSNGSSYSTLLLKNRETGLMDWFAPEKKAFVPTDFTHLIRMYPGDRVFEQLLYGITTKGDTLKYSRSKFSEAAFKPGKEYHLLSNELARELLVPDSDRFEDSAADNNDYTIPPEEQARLQQLFGVDSIQQESRFHSSLLKKYGIRKLYLARRGDKLGVLDQAGKERLPFEYDKIYLTKNSSQAMIFQGQKWGRKLFFTIYPTIEPIYEGFAEYHTLSVSPRWSFVVFRGKLNGTWMLIGENGVPYYNLD